MTRRWTLVALASSGCITSAGASFLARPSSSPSPSPSSSAPADPPPRVDGPVTTQLAGWPMPPAPPEGLRLCAKPGRPLIYCGEQGYDIFGLPVDYVKRAALAWGWVGVRIVEESGIAPDCILGTACRTNYRFENSHNGDVLVIHVLAPAQITAPPPE